MMKTQEEKVQYVKVTMVGYFPIKESELDEVFEAKTFDEALAHQRLWLDEGACDPNELMSEKLPNSVTLSWVDAEELEAAQ